MRLGVEGLALAHKPRVTIVLLPGPGGVLVNSLVLQVLSSRTGLPEAQMTEVLQPTFREQTVPLGVEGGR